MTSIANVPLPRIVAPADLGITLLAGRLSPAPRAIPHVSFGET